jgi:hypothetical protein
MWFQLIGHQWKPLLGVSLVGFVPLGIAVMVLLFVADLPGVIERLSDPDLVELMTLGEVVETLLPLVVAAVVGIVLQVVATAFVNVAAARISACAYAGVETDWRAASRFAVERIGKAIAAGLIVTLGVLVALALVAGLAWALISGLGTSFLTIFLTAVLVLTSLTLLIWLGVSLSLYSQSIAMSDRGAIASLLDSFDLVRLRWWVSVGFFLVTGLIASAAAQLLTLPLVPLFLLGAVAPAVLAVVYGVSAMIQGPVAAAIGVAYSVWYVDLRARRGPVESSELIR